MTAADMLKAYNFRDPPEEGSENDHLEKDHFTCEDLPSKLLFRPEEVAFHLSISKQTVYHWIEQGRIKAVRIHGLLHIPIPRVDILRKLSQIGIVNT